MDKDEKKDDNRETFDTGSVRQKLDEVRYDLISPFGLRRLAETYAFGAKKYGDHNWRLGQPVSQYLNHAINHIYDFIRGDNSEDHLAHAAWGLFAIMEQEVTHQEMDDRYRFEPEFRTSECPYDPKDTKDTKDAQRGFVYLASPYAHPDQRIREERADKAARAAAVLTKAGIAVYAPIAQNVNVAGWIDEETDTKKRGWDFWKHVDLPILEKARELLVLVEYGYKESVGIRGEVEHAKDLGIPIKAVKLSVDENGRDILVNFGWGETYNV